MINYKQGGKNVQFPKKSIEKLVVTVVLLACNVLGFGTEFFMHTRDGLGFYGTLNHVGYTIGYPYNEISLVLPMQTIFSLELSAGFDLKANTATSRVLALFMFENFQLGIPLELQIKNVKVESLEEFGRANAGLLFRYSQVLTGGVPVSVNFLALFSPYYLYYDPAFSVNIPTVHTEEVFRSKLEIKLSTRFQDVTLGFGYSAAFRWLPYRSMFITGQDSIFFEMRFKID